MRKVFLLIPFFLSGYLLPAQPSLYLSPGANLFITAGTPLAIDSLTLTPSINFNITGANGVLRTATTIHPAGNIYIRRVYQWSNMLPAFTGSLTIHYRDDELNGLNENELTLNVHNGTRWNAYNNAARDDINNFVTTPLLNVNLNELTLTSLSSPLPMRWLAVEAIRQNSVVHINWRTANEINCANYGVEKSSNALDWTNLGNTIPAYNSAGPNSYTLHDGASPSGVMYYRIRQTDLGGRYSYSLIVSVKGERTINTLVYPIPAGDILNIVAGNNLLLKSVNIYNAAGSLVAIEHPLGASLLTMDVHRLAAGNYTAVIALSDDSSVTRMFIKQ